MRYRHERWRKLFLREPVHRRLWSLFARGLRNYLLQVADNDGRLLKDSEDPTEDLLRALGAHGAELDLARGAVATLLADRFLVVRDRALFVDRIIDGDFDPPEPEEMDDDSDEPPPANESKADRRRRQDRERKKQNRADRKRTTSAKRPQNVRADNADMSAGMSAPSPPTPPSPKTDQTEKQPEAAADAGRASAAAADIPADNHADTSGGQDADASRGHADAEADTRALRPVRERCQDLLKAPWDALLSGANAWPELVAIQRAYLDAQGITFQPLPMFGKSGSTRALVEGLAAGFTVEQLCAAAISWAKSEHHKRAVEQWRAGSGSRPTLAWLKGQVLETEIAKQGDGAEQTKTKLTRREREERQLERARQDRARELARAGITSPEAGN